MNIVISSVVESLQICSRIIPILAVTLLTVDLLTAAGVIKKLFFIVKPIARTARLSGESTLALITSIGSVISADSMIAGFYQQGKMRGREALLSAQANSIAAYLRESITYFLPVVLPLLGFAPGLWYVSAVFLNAFLKIIFVLGIGRWLSSEAAVPSLLPEGKPNGIDTEESFGKIFTGLLRKTVRMMLRTAIVLFISSFLIVLLNKSGKLNNISVFIKPVMAVLQVPENLFVLIFGYLASPSGGAAALGNMYKSGEISMYCTSVAALMGGTLSLILATFRYTIPRNIALFGPKVGTMNAAVGFGIALFSRIVIIIILVTFFLR